jgi:hypothetical protein
MRNNLIPTVVVDKNNKVTTVHKRNGAPAPSASKLGSIKPALGTPQPKRKQAVSKVGFSATNTTPSKLVSFSPESFIGRAGLGKKAAALMKSMGGEGEVEMPNELLYDYLRLGIRPTEAALLHQISGGNLDALRNDPQFAEALPGDLARPRVWGGKNRSEKTVFGVVDFLAGAGIKPQKINAALQNHLNDELLENNVLSPEELTDIFNRFSYSLSTNEDKGTSASRTIDAIVDGRLPYALADRKQNVSRPTVSKILEALYPKTRAERASMDEADRARLAADPDMIMQVAKVLSAHNHWQSSVSSAYTSIQRFGIDASLEHRPAIMISRHSDGTALGPDGARRANEVYEFIKSTLQGNSANISLHATAYSYYDYRNGVRLTLEAADLSEMIMKGYSPEKIKEMTCDANMDSRRALAIEQGQVLPVVSEGWL